MGLYGKTILITGAGQRIGHSLAISLAKAGADIVVHYSNSQSEAEATAQEIINLGREARILKADFRDPLEAENLIERANQWKPLYALINNSAIFESTQFMQTTLEDWQRHLNVNLTSPFILSQSFANHLSSNSEGRIINILDWRALRPGGDHFAYTITKAALAAMTKSMAQALAPRITVNGIALGAILPPSDGAMDKALLTNVPARRWARIEEVSQTILFLLDGPSYITGEIIHVDGGRHLV